MTPISADSVQRLDKRLSNSIQILRHLSRTYKSKFNKTKTFTIKQPYRYRSDTLFSFHGNQITPNAFSISKLLSILNRRPYSRLTHSHLSINTLSIVAMSKTSFTTSTATATEVVQSFPSEDRSSPPITRMNSGNSSNSAGQEDEDLAGFMPDFSLMSMEQQRRSPNDDEKSVGLASTTGRFNHDIIGASGAPTKTCMPGGFFWRSKVRTMIIVCCFCVCLIHVVSRTRGCIRTWFTLDHPSIYCINRNYTDFPFFFCPCIINSPLQPTMKSNRPLARSCPQTLPVWLPVTL